MKGKEKRRNMEISLNTRAETAKLFLDTIRPLKSCYSPGHAFLHVGDSGVHYGEKAARMEGFARVLWGLGPLWAGGTKDFTAEMIQEAEEWQKLYLDGILHGTDPDHEEYWGDIFDFDQKMVEVAAIVYTIVLNQDRFWNDLTEKQQKQVYGWLNQINLYDMPKCNWRFFRIMANMTFDILGLPYPKERMDEDFDIINESYIGDGWYFDGTPWQLDYYVAYAIQFYGMVYGKLMKDRDPERSEIFLERGRQFYGDFIYWFANDGSEIPFGRSLTYRYAHGAPLGAMAFAELDNVNYGVLKNLVLGNLETWMKRPIFDHAGLLTIGYGYPQIEMSESYNSAGSPYWCNKTLVILALDDEHPFWKAEREAYPYEPVKFLKHPHMVITHDKHDHVMAYVTGQHLPNDHGQGPAKYEKFVYSNQFGFSISKGTNLAQGAFDSTLAVSVKGEDRYCMRYGMDDFKATEESLYTKYRPITGVTIESTVVPCSPWHVRVHRITNEVAIDLADGGFALPQERCFTVVSGRGTGKYQPSDVKHDGKTLIADFPWGVSMIASETGEEPMLITPFPNTNLFANLTVIPMVKTQLEPGTHLVVTSVAADFHESAETLLKEKPQVEIQDGKVVVTIGDKKVTV